MIGYYGAIFGFLCLILAYIDYKTHTIPNVLILPYFVLGIMLNLLDGTGVYIAVSLIAFIIFLFSPIESGGDIKFLTLGILYLRHNSHIYFMTLGFVCMLILIFNKIQNKKIKNMAFAPVMAVSFFSMLIFKCF